MNNLSKVTIAVTTLLATTAVSAASFNVRHEYKNETKQHSSRVKLADNIGNFLVDIEAKFKGQNGKFMEDLQINGWELGLNYRHVLNDNWTLTYGMPIEARSAGMTYKPQLRATYQVDSIDGLSLSARYRYDIKHTNGSTSYVDDNDDGNFEPVVNPSKDERRHRVTANINYALDDWRFGFEGNYYKAEGYNLYNNKDTNYELNATVAKRMGQWTPSVEFGDVNVSSTSDKRELRSRIGLTYSF
ncbi:N-acetylneuraminic acid outer membrane channel protein NanC [Vibrio maritimus]|uniref:N-acetylneuraminic acid outer membrane channel protein NanC n=1 Tax=Vibrio maritimus TaxID=990268 RepID=A0A090T151_9VIBR|nr:N-acetylneuraminic acid outer membrane channel protein NanC [Vibrio maritimus]